MYCTKCGNYVDSNSKYCERCGSPIFQNNGGYQRPMNEHPINENHVGARPATRRPAVAYAGAVSGSYPTYYEHGYQILSRPTVGQTAPTMVYMAPASKPQVSPVVKRNTELSGLLQFIVVMLKTVSPMMILASLAFYISKTVRAIFQLEDMKTLYSRFGIGYNYYDKVITYSLMLAGLMTVFCVSGAIVMSVLGRKIEKRDPGFLKMVQGLYITITVVLLAIPFITVLLNSYAFGFDPVFELKVIVPEEIMYLLVQIVGFILWNLYFTKSKKVYEYMGSDEYLRKSIFNKNTRPPM